MALLLDSHHGSHVIVGHSLGGMLALEAALIDRSRVLGMVLVSAIAGTTPGVAAHNEALAADIEVRGIRIVADEFADRLFAPGRSHRSPDLKTDFLEAMAECGATAVCAALRAIARWYTRADVPPSRESTVMPGRERLNMATARGINTAPALANQPNRTTTRSSRTPFSSREVASIRSTTAAALRSTT
jgi:pimeloyl-ACP methyl ester carboxylesterase